MMGKETKNPQVFGNSWKMPDPVFECPERPNIHICAHKSNEEIEEYQNQCKVLANKVISK